MSDQPQPIGELPNGDLVWPGPTYLIRIHGDPERYVDRDICDVIQNHYNVLARIEPERTAVAPEITDEMVERAGKVIREFAGHRALWRTFTDVARAALEAALSREAE